MGNVLNKISESKDLIIDLQTKLTSIPSLAPENGGQGEYDKFLFLKGYLKNWPFDSFDEYLAADDRVKSKKRPSLVATINGQDKSKNIWIISHLDIVPPGELKLWDNDPYSVAVKDDKIYGRGTEDNQQSLVSSLIAAKSILDSNIKPKYTTRLLFVADEEVGSEYGIQWLLKKENIFSKHDIIIPDGGNEKGDIIEIAEKSILWMDFIIKGKQSHGSRPDHGINTATASSHLVVKMEQLRSIFNKIDDMYDLPYSTFEPTKRSNNITNINTIPGEETLSYDCRVLPDYNLDDITSEINKIVNSIEKEFKVKIEIKYPIKVNAPSPTPKDAEVVKMLQASIKRVMGINAKPIGIGGGTVAAYFRMKNYNAAIWSTIDSTMHSPNEYSSIKNTINDAKVFADLLLN